MTRRQILGALTAIAAAAAQSASKRPNFIGRWRLDESRSSRDAPRGLTEVIDHRDTTLRIDSDWDRTQPTGLSNAALLAPTLKLGTDGAESVNDMPMRMSLATRSHWDGGELVTEWRLNGLAPPLNGTWKRYLTGPDTMVVDAVSEGDRNRASARLVFVK
jgi:hypothetical protein